MRVGHGFDLHKIEAQDGGSLMLCGVAVKCDKIFIAHSDGDVGLHALTDAILGAIGEEDIGMHFPPTDKTWKNADSKIFLQKALDLMKAKGGFICNVDITLVAEKPKLMEYKQLMKNNIASLLSIPNTDVSVKAKTSEGLGVIGSQLAIAAFAVCCISME